MKKSFKYIVILFSMLIGGYLCAQNITIERQVIGSSGLSNTGGNMNAAYTLGEAFITFYDHSRFTVSEGFHQPIHDTTAIDDGVLILYSGFTPNDDGINDKWIIDGIEHIHQNEVRILNRWGQEIWFGEGYDNVNVVWGGEMANSGELVPDGTYFYLVKLIETNKTYRRWIQVTR